jgi:hypothetical protein
VDYSDVARNQIATYERQGFDWLPVCIAKTHLSLSDNASLKGRPSDFRVTVNEVRLSAGAGFLVPLCGDISRMPGLPRVPAATRIDLDASGTTDWTVLNTRRRPAANGLCFIPEVIMSLLFCLMAGALASSPSGALQHEHAKTPPASYSIPESLKVEHHELHAELATLLKLGGKTGPAAEAVEQALAPHFTKEEEYALPPLGLLKALADGKISPDMHAAAEMASRLKADLPHMIEEHQAIVKALDQLAAAGRAERHAAALQFTEKLKLHARNEEEVLYPAAILVGEYVKLRMQH